MKKTTLKRIAAIAAVAAIGGAIAVGVMADAEKTITLQIGNPKMTVDGTEKNIDDMGTAPIIDNDRTMLPIRAIIEELGGTVDWDDETKTITIKVKTADGTVVETVSQDDAEVKTEMKQINGINISVKEAGSGPDMILVHGRGYSKECMDRLFNYYKNQYHVISYDARGHGESDKPESFNLDDHAEDLSQLIAAYGMSKPVVIGFSMGSYITLNTAEKYPDLFSKIVLIGTKGGGATSSVQSATQQGQAEGLSPEEMALMMQRRIFAPQVTSEDIAEFDKEIASSVTLTQDEQDAITKSLQNFDLLANADKVTIPALVLTGEYDGLNPPSEGEKVAEALPNATFEIISDAGHIAFFENLEQVVSLVDDFISNK